MPHPRGWGGQVGEAGGWLVLWPDFVLWLVAREQRRLDRARGARLVAEVEQYLRRQWVSNQQDH